MRYQAIIVIFLLYIFQPRSSLAQVVLEEESSDLSSAETQQSSWIFSPKLSKGPKFGLLLGAAINHLKKNDQSSPLTITGFSGSYSNTHSYAFILYNRTYWMENTKRINAFISGLRIRNDYQDYLGQGAASVENNYKIVYGRMQTRVSESPLFVGGSYTYANVNPHALNPESVILLEQNNVEEAISAGLAINITYDSRDNYLNPQRGIYIESSVSSYNKFFGGDSDYLAFYLDYSQYIPVFTKSVLAYNLSLLSTPNAPESALATLRDFRAYTTGEYTAENAVTGQIELRANINQRWTFGTFTGVGVLFNTESKDNAEDQVLPMCGLGVHYIIDEKSKAIVRLDLANGTGANQAFYLHFGQAF